MRQAKNKKKRENTMRKTIEIGGVNPHDAGLLMHLFCELSATGCTVEKYSLGEGKCALMVSAKVEAEMHTVIAHLAQEMLFNGWTPDETLEMINALPR